MKGTDKRKVRVLVFSDWYHPAFKAGGPIRSAVNFVDNLKTELDIYVLTSNHDLDPAELITDRPSDQWIDEQGVQIFYSSATTLSWKNLLNHIREIAPDYIYLNSLFSLFFTIYPLLQKRFGLIKSGIILSPRGMLRISALSHKRLKKSVFLNLMRLSGIGRLIHFHATDQQEETDIRKNFSRNAGVTRIENLTAAVSEFISPPEKLPGKLKMIFIGRVHPIKNLDYVLECLLHVKSDIEILIIAPDDDKPYWERCRLLIDEMPANIQISVKHSVPNKELKHYLQQTHVFFLPTKGENFGHAIFEAFQAGRPVLISDQTPWRQLEEKGIGYDIPLHRKEDYITAINRFAEMNNATLLEWSRNAWNFSREIVVKSDVRKNYIKLFSK